MRYRVGCLRDPTFSGFSRTPTCDRQTDGHMMTAYTALAWRRAVKTNVCVSQCITEVHNTAQNSADNLPYYSPGNHRSSDVVY